MKKAFSIILFFFFALPMVKAQNPINWTPQQVEEPADLAKAIQSGTDVPVIFSVGPGSTIPHSIALGSVSNQANLDSFQTRLASLPKNTNLVIYCGCCPFEHCPNVRPAIAALKEKGFSNYKLLNLPHNLKADWIDKGYPVEK